jgi:GNAT superfamily N-acetyltransferase
MSYLIRSWTDRDAGIDREISQAIYPEYREEPRHPAWFPAQQLGRPSDCSSQYVAVDTREDRPVGYATLWELRPQRYRFDLAVRPEWQGQGIASQLLDQLTIDAKALGATGLQARVRDDKHDALEFIRRRGYQESHRMGAYRLDFGNANVMDFQEACGRLRDCGIELTSLVEARQQNSDYKTQFYELYSAARDGWPDPDPGPTQAPPIPYEWVNRWLEEVRSPEAFFIATCSRRYIAFISFHDIGTAVHPEFRGRGIATLLKSASIADARCRGFQGDTTSTASPAMQKVLQRLGYKRLWAEIRLIREMA